MDVDNKITTMIIKDTTSNPAPLGLFGFGMTTVLLNLANAGLFSLSTMVLATGIFYGGIAQIIAGVMEWKKNNMFGAVAFTSFGAFWLTLVGLIVMPGMGWGSAADKGGMVAYFIVWGLFTLFMFVATLRINKALQVVFATLVVLFALLALHEATGNATLGKITGWEGILCGASAIYAAVAQVWNEYYGKVMLPLGVVKK
jgi:succinate-acetate transporter protein